MYSKFESFRYATVSKWDLKWFFTPKPKQFFSIEFVSRPSTRSTATSRPTGRRCSTRSERRSPTRPSSPTPQSNSESSKMNYFPAYFWCSRLMWVLIKFGGKFTASTLLIDLDYNPFTLIWVHQILPGFLIHICPRRI